MSLSADEIRADHVAIYIRWSTEDQGEGTTLDIQTEACKGFLMTQGWQFRPDLVFVDDGVSGATMIRPELGRLRTLVKQREIDCVVVYKLDRLSRSVLDMLKLVLEEWDGLCSIKSAREPIDTMTATGKMFFYQLMSFAEWERSVIRDRMFAGRLRRAHEGKNPGFVLPYGYRKGSDGKIEQDPAEAPVIKYIFELYLTGLGARMISKKLDQEGHSSPTGRKWSEGTILKVLDNPSYKGTFVFGRERTIKGHKRVKAKEPHVVKEGFFPAIVSPQVWDEVAEVRADRPCAGRPDKGHGRTLGSQNLLTGLLRCTCGRSCSGIAPTLRGTTYRYYICGAAQNTGSHLCPAGNIRQDHLDRVVMDKLLALFRGSDARERVLAQLQGEMRTGHERAVLARQSAEQEVRRLEESDKRVKGMFLDAKLTVDEFRGLAGELGAKLKEAREGHSRAIRAEVRATEALDHDRQRSAVLDRLDEWEGLELLEKKQVLRQFIKQIVVFRDKQTDEVALDITWRWTPGVGQEEGTLVYRPEREYGDLKRFARGRPRVNGRFVPVAGD